MSLKVSSGVREWSGRWLSARSSLRRCGSCGRLAREVRWQEVSERVVTRVKGARKDWSCAVRDVRGSPSKSRVSIDVGSALGSVREVFGWAMCAASLLVIFRRFLFA